MNEVSVIKSFDYYEPDFIEKVRAAITPVIDLRVHVKKGTRVLLKPNLLTGAVPEKAVTTHPMIVLAVGRIVKGLGAELWIGDSGGFGSTAANARKAGLYDVIEELGARLIPFTEPIEINVPDAKYVKNFKIEKAVLDADFIINLPKLKTHGLTMMTGAAKNLYGCIPGLEKGKGHLRMPERELFSQMIVDLNLAVKPDLNVMDGVIAMEGNGPGSGTPRKLGVIIAGTDTMLVDAVACRIIGLPFEKAPVLRYARARGLMSDPEKIKIYGERLESVMVSDFKLINQGSSRKKVRNMLLGLLGKSLDRLFIDKPVPDLGLCKGCGICVDVCPVKTIAMEAKVPVFNYVNCIKCYCCQELCPHGAIKLKRKIF